MRGEHGIMGALNSLIVLVLQPSRKRAGEWRKERRWTYETSPPSRLHNIFINVELIKILFKDLAEEEKNAESAPPGVTEL